MWVFGWFWDVEKVVFIIDVFDVRDGILIGVCDLLLYCEVVILCLLVYFEV